MEVELELMMAAATVSTMEMVKMASMKELMRVKQKEVHLGAWKALHWAEMKGLALAPRLEIWRVLLMETELGKVLELHLVMGLEKRMEQSLASELEWNLGVELGQMKAWTLEHKTAMMWEVRKEPNSDSK
jgi:hypothetical protein